jgi:imidazole glycerol phosphate synthase glutamine amidotransferase subunit
MNIEIIDLGVNNIRSLMESVTRNSGEVKITVIEKALESNCPNVVFLPGIGNFGAAMKRMQEAGFKNLIQDLSNSEVKVVGICLALQLFGLASEESPNVEGLGIIPGTSSKLPISNEEKIPNVGWSEVSLKNLSAPFQSLNTQRDYYFVHSYSFLPDDQETILGTSKFGNYEFVSAVHRDNLLAFQFHPEKSGNPGNALMKEILEWANE